MQANADKTTPVQDSAVIIDFGGQNSSGTGTIMVGTATTATYAQIVAYAESFASGYATCAGSAPVLLSLMIGTNNSAYQVSSAGGAKWATAVIAPVSSWISSHSAVASHVTAFAANDLEPDWSSASSAVAWMQGYVGATSRAVENFGAASGCPQTTYGGGACNNGWTQYTVWYLSWGPASAYAFPEIYFNSMSLQWTMISKYGYYHQTGKVVYDGPLTQYQAPINGSTTLSSDQAWNRFWTDLNSSSVTAQSFQFRSDI